MVGYAITDQKKYLDFQLKKYELESLQDDRITVAVEVCGVCGSVRLFFASCSIPL
jgi:alcohol dehydrogenase (NADP+)